MGCRAVLLDYKCLRYFAIALEASIRSMPCRDEGDDEDECQRMNGKGS